MSGVLNDGVSTTDLLIRQDILIKENIDGLFSVDPQQMPGRIHVSDATSDGFPDIMLTAKNVDGGTSTYILLNSPCIGPICSTAARDSMRRVFLESKQAKGKYANDDLEIDPRNFLNEVF